jgi:hypothetical protein
MKLPSSSLLASIALTGLPLLSASAITEINDVDDSNANSIDAGILDIRGDNSSNEAPFFRDLQSTCPETCSSALCDCVSQYGFAEPCSQQLHDVCTGTAGSIEDCVVPEYVFYYQNVYCPFAACRVSGESYEKCQCDSYINFCGIYQNKAGYETDPKTLKYCSISTCCQLATDDTGRNECLTESFQAVGFNSTVVANATSDQPGTTDATISTGGETESTASPESESTTSPESDATTTESLEPIDLTGGEAEVEAGDKDIPAAVNACDVKRSSVLSMVVGAFIWLLM